MKTGKPGENYRGKGENNTSKRLNSHVAASAGIERTNDPTLTTHNAAKGEGLFLPLLHALLFPLECPLPIHLIGYINLPQSSMVVGPTPYTRQDHSNDDEITWGKDSL